jgi:hypothetical protein
MSHFSDFMNSKSQKQVIRSKLAYVENGDFLKGNENILGR